jgi:hypothetical protein
MEWAVTPDELRPVTIDDVISPIPMNPSCISLSFFPLQHQADISLPTRLSEIGAHTQPSIL